jgi:hypothetical protein
MKFFYLLLVTLLFTTLSFSQDVYISEINYTGSDPGVELTGNGVTDLSGWKLSFYKGANRKEYHIIDLVQRLDNSILWIPVDNILNHPQGAGVALIDNNGEVVEFLFSYGTSPFEAKNGLAQGSGSSKDIGSTNGEQSLQKTDTGWIPAKPTPGKQNSNKSLSVVKDQIEDFNIYPNPVRNGKISISTKNSLNKNVVIYSILGSVVYNKTVHPNEVINVQNLSTGLYLVQVEEDEKTSVRKLLIN